MAPSGALMRVGVEAGPSWAATTPSMVVKEGYFTIPGGNPGRTYDVSPDGQQFLMIKLNAPDLTRGGNGVVIVQNWFEELKARVPVP